MTSKITRTQLDSLQDSLKSVVGEPEEEQLNEAEDEKSKEEKPKDPPKQPEEPKTLQEVYTRLQKLGEKGQTLGPNETERHERAIQHLETLVEKLHELLGDREAEAEEGSKDNESSG